MASILGRSDDNFGNFSCDTLEGRDFEKICSHVEKKVIQIFASYKGECNGDGDRKKNVWLFFKILYTIQLFFIEFLNYIASNQE